MLRKRSASRPIAWAWAWDHEDCGRPFRSPLQQRVVDTRLCPDALLALALGLTRGNGSPRFVRRGIFDFKRRFPSFGFVVDAGDYRLQVDSPAIDAGPSASAAAIDVDLNGNLRRCGDAVDIGAYESACVTPIQFRRGDCNGDGVPAGLDDALFLLAANFAGGETPACRAACGANTDGRVEGDLSDAISILRFVFASSAPPGAPFPECGEMVSPGDLLLSCVDSPCE